MFLTNVFRLSILCFFLTLVCVYGMEPLTYTVSFEPPEIMVEQIDVSGTLVEYHRIIMEGLLPFGEPGYPQLPAKACVLALPPNAVIDTVEVIDGPEQFLDGHFNVFPAQPAVAWDEMDTITFTEQDESIYASNNTFPETALNGYAIQYKHGYPLLVCTLCPVHYQPLSGTLSYHQSLTIRVVFKEEAEPSETALIPGDASSSTTFRGLQRDMDQIRALALNPELLSNYEQDDYATQPVGMETAFSGFETSLLPERDFEEYPYLIVTSDLLLNTFQGDNPLQQLLDHKLSRGVRGTWVTVEYIAEHYDGTRPDGGEDLQTKIRNCIRDAYVNWHTDYVLLLGDSDWYEGTEIDRAVPTRKLRYYPSDYYYSCLDGSFDGDGDGFYGEPLDGPDSSFVDLYAEVYVGRVPADSEVDVINFVNKTIAYESCAGASYLRNYAMVGEYMGFGGIAEYASSSLEELRFGTDNHGYTTKGIMQYNESSVTTVYEEDDPEWQSHIAPTVDASVHILNHFGHSGYAEIMDFISNDPVPFNNTEYFLGYSQGCNPGEFTYEYCIIEKWVCSAAGPFAFVANSGKGYGAWESTDGPSQRLHREFIDAIFGEHIRHLARINTDSHEDQAAYVMMSGNGMMWEAFYGSNLLGDPETPLLIPDMYSAQKTWSDARPLKIRVYHPGAGIDPSAQESLSVTLSSSSDAEQLTLLEESANSPYFSAAIEAEEGSSPVSGNGVIEGVNNEIIALYYSSDHILSGISGHREESVVLDFVDPTVSNISVDVDPSAHTATVQWETSEPTVGYLTYKPEGSTQESVSTWPLKSAGIFIVELSDLRPETAYEYTVYVKDEAGNETVISGLSFIHNLPPVMKPIVDSFIVEEGRSVYFPMFFEDNDQPGLNRCDLFCTDYGAVMIEAPSERWSGSSAEYLLDAANNTDWCSSFGSQIETVILQPARTLPVRCLHSETAFYSSDGAPPLKIEVYYSENEDGPWIFHCELNPPSGRWTIPIEPLTAEYIRIDMSESGSDYIRTDCMRGYGPLNLDGHSFSGEGLPEGATVTGDGYFEWTPTSGQDGVYAGITVKVSDTFESDQDSFTITVIEAGDRDNDGLSNYDEIVHYGTDPDDDDSENDGMSDGWEVQYGLNPLTDDHAGDPDYDGLNNLAEYRAGTNPFSSDTDEDTMPDGWEYEHGSNPAVNDADADADSDGLTTLQEYQHNTYADDSDSDDDGLNDYEEVIIHGTNPLYGDSDWDMLSDYEEVQAGLNPLSPDTDGDGYLDFEDEDPLQFDLVYVIKAELPSPTDDFTPSAVNNRNHVVGWGTTAEGTRAFLLPNPWTFEELDLVDGASYAMAYDINDEDQVVGESGYRAFLYDNGVMTDIGTLGGTKAKALGINNEGDVMICASRWVYAGWNRFTWTRIKKYYDDTYVWNNGAITDIGSLGGYQTIGRSINDAGHIVGSAMTAAGSVHAFVYTPGIGIEDKWEDSGCSWFDSINTYGEMVGWSYNTIKLCDQEDVVWQGSFGPDTYVRAMNNHAQVVGVGRLAGSNERHAWILDQYMNMHDLNDVLEAQNAQIWAGWTIVEAYDINDVGVIIATIRHPELGRKNVYIVPYAVSSGWYYYFY